MQKQLPQLPIPAGKKAITSEILTVMFTDMVGYTSTTAQLNRVEFTALLDIFDKLSVPVFEKHQGTIVKKIGDAFLVTFRSPTDAVLCGIDLQRTFKRNRLQTQQPLHIRVAIHTGEVLLRNNDVYGDAVNTASRIEGVANSGQVVFSEAVFLAMNKNEVPCMYLGMKHLKGLPYPIRIFRVKTREDERRMRWESFKRLFSQILVVGILGTLFVFIVRYLWLYTDIFSKLFGG